MPERPLNALHREMSELAERLAHIDERTDPISVRRWAKDLSTVCLGLDLRMRAGEPLPDPWKRKARG